MDLAHPVLRAFAMATGMSGLLLESIAVFPGSTPCCELGEQSSKGPSPSPAQDTL